MAVDVKAYWVGVVGSREGAERLRTSDETWWCISRSAKAGDRIAIYVAGSKLGRLPEEQTGVTAIFEILGPEPERASECRTFGGSSFGGSAPVPVKMIVRSRYPIGLRLADMKLDRTLATAKFVRRSFQGTYFEATLAEFARIEKMLEKKTQTFQGQSASGKS